ncbi:MAG: dihydropteroate synthase, partial [Planctomycetota bacterium]|nr:dihydropteroate synthase [Planctomycetota bacterium]
MGIVNVTPDSFSDGGQFDNTAAAVDHALQLADDGAAILDIGGESTRPYATEVSTQEELNRVIPVI